MKTIFVYLAVMLIRVLSLFAQKPVQETIPQLKEWWVAPPEIKGLGRYGVSYIPNFYHGRDAMGVSINNGQMVTWLNRFPGDTTNVFTWKGGGPVMQGDFNGDGITDYMAGGYIYRGIKNGEPPDSVPVRYQNFFTDQVLDVNHDGYDDIVSIAGLGFTTIAQILYGASDFNTMKFVNIDRIPPIDTTMYGDKIYMGADGNMRFIMYTHKWVNSGTTVRNGYVLFKATWQKGDTLPKFEKLSSVLRFGSNDLQFSRGASGYYSGKHTDKKLFIPIEYIGSEYDYKNNVVFYDVAKDSFDERLRFRLDGVGSSIYPLKRSIDSDSIEDLVIRGPGKILFFSGKTLGTVDTSGLLATYNVTCSGQLAYSIGDINNDGIADIVTGVGCVSILEGLKSKPDGISEHNMQSTISLTDTSPFPLKKNIASTLKITIPKQGLYHLEIFTLTGQYLGEILNQILEAGEQKIVINVSSLLPASGTYILNLRSESGNVIVQRTIIIE
ncbi:MAG: VCBS repeat-containing protein [Bacteroidetes bacterium]|nr:VCBS repeat-containing protein [Bacteroidota bacterium]